MKTEKPTKRVPSKDGNPLLTFYQQPFEDSFDMGWVYDDSDNFVFQFLSDETTDLQKQIIESINAKKRTPIKGLKLRLGNTPIEIIHEDKILILIRGWGNLTGIGAHNFSAEKASEIQNDFVKWFLWRVCEN